MPPESPLAKFYFPVRVRFADTDLQGHVFFGNYFTYMDEAFMAYIDELGFAWQTLGEMGLAVYYVDSGCQFKGPSFFGDRLNVHTQISQLGNSSLTAEMTVVRERDRKVWPPVISRGFWWTPGRRKINPHSRSTPRSDCQISRTAKDPRPGRPSMKAMLLHQLCRLADNPAPLKLMDLPVPEPAEGEILVKVTCLRGLPHRTG
jgi:YbgC/YbaW family acyl-CoA thioester hydrolase